MQLKSDNVLILPGWLDSGPGHWQSRWQAAHDYTRVAQHDWARPLRGDWIARLEDVVLAQNADLPITLVAHSLGCLLVVAWAALSRNTHRVKCAFLAAPCDVTLEALRPVLTSWKPITPHLDAESTSQMRFVNALASASEKAVSQKTASRTPIARTPMPQTLPFKSLLLASRTDPYCSFERARALATDWGSDFVDCGACGHINAEAGLDDWPQGHELLLALMRGEPAGTMRIEESRVERVNRVRGAAWESSAPA